MTDISRRRLFGLLGGAAVATSGVTAAPSLFVFGPSSITTISNLSGSELSAQIVATTTRVFAPRVLNNLYTQNPLISIIVKGD